MCIKKGIFSPSLINCILVVCVWWGGGEGGVERMCVRRERERERERVCVCVDRCSGGGGGAC